MEKSKRQKFLISCSIIAASAIAVGGFLFYKSSQEKLISALSERQLAIAQLSAHRIALELNHIKELVNIHAQAESSKLFLEQWGNTNLDNPAHRQAEVNLQNYLDDLFARTKNLGSFSIISPLGHIILSTDPAMKGLNVADRAYFQDAMVKKEITYAPILSRQSETPLIAVAEPVVTSPDATPLGVFCLHVPLTNLARDLMLTTRSASDSQLFVVDTSGTVLLHENADYNLRHSIEQEDWFRQIREVRKDSFTTYSNDKELLVSVSPIQGTNWLAVTLSNIDTVLEPVEYFLNLTLLGTLLFMCVLAGGVYIAFSHKKSRSLQEAKDLAESLSNAKSLFMANISHEIRTPMNAIMGLNHLLARTQLDARQKDYLEKTNAASQNLLHLINDILDFSRIETGQLEIAQNNFSLDALFSSLSAIAVPHAEAKKLEILFRISPHLPTCVIGDDIRLTQILLKLINNAVKFTESGEVIISLEGKVESLPPNAPMEQNEKAPLEYAVLTFTVHDTGIGMDAEEVSKLFSPFNQADNSLTRRFGGAGLGLALTKRMLELMGSVLEVHSAKGKGSDFSFTVRLPVAPPCPREYTSTIPNLEGLRVLVVDDNPSACFVLREMLENRYMDVDEAGSGVEAVLAVKKAHAERNPYALVFMDWKMPGLDGVKTAIQLRQFPAEKPLRIILVTGYLYEPDPIHPHLFDAILHKPVNASALYNALVVCENSEDKGKNENAPPAPCFSLEGEVLLVEDNLINQLIAGELLNLHGINPDIAQNGKEALEKFKLKHYDLVLMDIQMPEMDGLDATRQIRYFEKSTGAKPVPIVAMTAHALQEDKVLSFAAGMDGHISKPIDPELLAHTLHQWLPCKPQEK